MLNLKSTSSMGQIPLLYLETEIQRRTLTNSLEGDLENGKEDTKSFPRLGARAARSMWCRSSRPTTGRLHQDGGLCRRLGETRTLRTNRGSRSEAICGGNYGFITHWWIFDHLLGAFLLPRRPRCHLRRSDLCSDDQSGYVATIRHSFYIIGCCPLFTWCCPCDFGLTWWHGCGWSCSWWLIRRLTL